MGVIGFEFWCIIAVAAAVALIVTAPIYIWSEWYTEKIIQKYKARESCWED